MNTAEKNRDGSYGSSPDKFEPVKWFIGLVLIAVAIYGNSYFGEESMLYRVIGVIVLVGGALFVLSLTVKGREFVRLLKEARSEMRKIVWPARQETMQTTFGVVVIVLIVALILWMVDTLLGWLILKIIG
jgi:preprotein translocase subunit SecE